MRKVVGVLVLALALMSLASAQQTQTSQPQLLSQAGPITPNSGFLYNLDVLLDNLWLLIHPSPITKINIMNERLAEYRLTNSTTALGDYMTKLESIESDLNQAVMDNMTRSYVEEHLATHVEVLMEYEKKVPPQAKPAIEHAINESSKVLQKMKEHCHECLKKGITSENMSGNESIHGSQTGEINAPSTVRVGEDYTISWKICNPFKSDINSLHMKVFAKKSGLLGFFIKKQISQTYRIYIPSGSCYKGSESVTVPESMFGIPLSGKWDVDITVTALPQDKVIVKESRQVFVG